MSQRKPIGLVAVVVLAGLSIGAIEARAAPSSKSSVASAKRTAVKSIGDASSSEPFTRTKVLPQMKVVPRSRSSARSRVRIAAQYRAAR